MVAEDGVRSPLRIDAVAQKIVHNKKQKRIPDAVKSNEYLYSEDMKWHQLLAEKYLSCRIC